MVEAIKRVRIAFISSLQYRSMGRFAERAWLEAGVVG
jgi:hypothetical protein